MCLVRKICLDKETDHCYTETELQVMDMTEKISILGVELKDYSMEDAARVIEEYLNNDVLNTSAL